MNTDLFKQYLFVAIRYVTPWLASYLATKLGLVEADIATWISTTLNVLMAVWSLFNKAHYEDKVNTALELQSGTSKDSLKNVIASGNGAGATAVK